VNFRYVWQQLFRALTMDDEKALNTPQEAAKVLRLTAQRAQQDRAMSAQSGSAMGGQNEGLMSLIQNQEAA